MDRLLFICIGGAFGTGARYLLSIWTARVLGTSFPFGTLLCNAIGSFFIGVLMHIGLATNLLSPTLRLVLVSGVMGGFTTYSTFNYETLRLVEEGAWPRGLLNILVTVIVCLIMGTIGNAGGRWMLSR